MFISFKPDSFPTSVNNKQQLCIQRISLGIFAAYLIGSRYEKLPD